MHYSQLSPLKILCYTYNIEQRVIDNLTKLSKIDFSLKCFTVACQNLAFRWLAEYVPSNLSLSGIFL